VQESGRIGEFESRVADVLEGWRELESGGVDVSGVGWLECGGVDVSGVGELESLGE
jgi:hypothetical protein